MRGFAFLGFSFSFEVSAERCCRVVWVCTQGWSNVVSVGQSKMHFTCSHECVFS
ncbi:hypothetical protein Z945_3758 [Sulfitobacter noctilucae]|nr:hypothetical protein Z945_3758 [Sulfitobacter noctilucae]